MVTLLILTVLLPSPFIILALACIAIERRNDHKLFNEMLKARGQLG